MPKTIVLSAQIEGLNDPLRRLSELDLALKSTNKELGLTAKEIQKLKDFGVKPTKDLTDRYEELKRVQFDLREETKELNKEVRTSVNEFKKAQFPVGSIQQMEQAYSKLRREIRALGADELASASGQSKIAEARALKDAIREQSIAFGDTTPNIGNYREAIEQAIQGNGSLVGNLKGVVGGLLGPAGLVAGLAAAGVGLLKLVQFISGTTTEFVKLRGQVDQLTNLTDAQVNEVTARIKTLADVYQEDFQKVLIGINAANQAFGGNLLENLDQIEIGLLAGANANEEFFDSFKEYPALFAQAGGTLDQFVQVLTRSAQEGIYSDKAIDAIKEGNIQLREQTKATRDALQEAFGPEFTDDVLGRINEGTLTTLEGVQLISAEMEKGYLTTAQYQTIVADVFRGAGEDAADGLFRVIRDINGSTADLVDNTNDLVISQKRQLDSTNRLNLAKARLSENFANLVSGSNTFFTNIQTFGLELLNDMVERVSVLSFRLDQLFSGNIRGAFMSEAAILGVLAAQEALTRETEKQRDLQKGTPKALEQSFGKLRGDLEGIEAALAKTGLTTEQTKFLESLKEEAEIIKERKDITDEYAKGLELLEQRTKVYGLTQKEVLIEQANLATQAIDGLLGTGLDSSNRNILGLRETLRGVSLDLANIEVSEAWDEQELQEYNATLEEVKKRTAELVEQDRLLAQAREGGPSVDQYQKVQEEAQKSALRLLDIEEDLAMVKASETIQSEKELQEELLRIEREFAIQRLRVKMQGLDEYEIEYRKLQVELLKLEKEQQEEGKFQFAASREELTEVGIDAARQLVSTLATLERNRLEQDTDEKLSKLEEEYQKRIEAAAGNAAEQERLEEELQAKKDKIERDAAKERKAIAIKEAIIQGALSLIKALANPALAALTALATATQIAIIRSQKFAMGGFTGQSLGKPDETGHVPVGIVHANEYVVPKGVVYDPKAQGALSFLEQLRIKKGYATSRRKYDQGGLAGGAIPLFQAPAPQLGGSLDEEVIRVMAEQIAVRVYDAALSGTRSGSRAGSMEGADQYNRRMERDRQAEELRTY